jgi:hypothetical protein
MPGEINWQEMYVIAEKISRGFYTTKDRVKELKSVAVTHLWAVHNRYDGSRGAQFSAWAHVVMKRAMLKQLKVWKEWDEQRESIADDRSDDAQDRRRSPYRSRTIEVEDEGVKCFEAEFDLCVNMEGFFRLLTPSEKRALDVQMQHPNATSDELAVLAGFSSGGAVRIHLYNVRKKFNSLQNMNINKVP